jgi:DNA-binding response OmpR family regulator
MSLSMTLPQYHRNECSVDGRKVHLTMQEKALLLTLLLRKGHMTSLVLFIEILWENPDTQPECADDLVRSLVIRVRNKIKPYRIVNRHGFGYILE